MLKRIGSLLLSLALVLGVMIPAANAAVTKNSAKPTIGLDNLPEGVASTGPVKLYLTYKPGGTATSSAEDQAATQGYRLYYIASIQDKTEGEGKAYVVTPTYQGVEGLEALLKELDPLSAKDNAKLYTEAMQNSLKTGLTNYINSGSVKPNAVNAIQNGESAFVDLPYGLYYVLGPQAQTQTQVGSYVYTPINFVASIPFISATLDNDGNPIEGTEVENNFLVSDMKFSARYIGGGGGGHRPPERDSDADADDDSDADSDTDSDVDIPDPDVPLSDKPDIVDIPEDDVPLADVPDVVDIPDLVDIIEEDVPLSNVKPPVTTIPDNKVPLARLPQTGLLWWPVPAMGLAGVGCILVGAKGRGRSERDQ